MRDSTILAPNPLKASFSNEVLRGKAISTTRNSCVEFHTLDVPEPQPNEVLIRLEWSYISAGTELNAVRGCREGREEFLKPRRLGYSLSGVVHSLGANVDHVAVGDRVVAIGSGAYHGTYAMVGKNLVCRVPDKVSMKEASCMAMLCFALEGVRKARVQFGENTVVLGGGLMGQIVSRLCAMTGAATTLIDSNFQRLEFCDPLVQTIPLNGATWTALRKQVQPHGLEVGFVCFGGDATTAVEQIVAAMSRGPDDVATGRIVFCGGAQVTLRMASPSGNVQFLSSAKAGPGYRDAKFENGQAYTPGYVKWTVQRNMEALLAALEHGHLDIASLITHEFAFEDAEAAYSLLLKPNTEAMAVVLKYE